MEQSCILLYTIFHQQHDKEVKMTFDYGETPINDAMSTSVSCPEYSQEAQNIIEIITGYAPQPNGDYANCELMVRYMLRKRNNGEKILDSDFQDRIANFLKKIDTSNWKKGTRKNIKLPSNSNTDSEKFLESEDSDLILEKRANDLILKALNGQPYKNPHSKHRLPPKELVVSTIKEYLDYTDEHDNFDVEYISRFIVEAYGYTGDIFNRQIIEETGFDYGSFLSNFSMNAPFRLPEYGKKARELIIETIGHYPDDDLSTPLSEYIIRCTLDGMNRQGKYDHQYLTNSIKHLFQGLHTVK